MMNEKASDMNFQALVIDDERQVREFVATGLRGEGWRVAQFPAAEEAFGRGNEAPWRRRRIGRDCLRLFRLFTEAVWTRGIAIPIAAFARAVERASTKILPREAHGCVPLGH